MADQSQCRILNWIELIRWSKLTFKVDVSLTKKVLIMKFYWRCLTFDFVEFIPGKSLLSWSMSLAFWEDCVEFDRWCVDVFLLWDMFRLDLCLGKNRQMSRCYYCPLAIWREKLVRKFETDRAAQTRSYASSVLDGGFRQTESCLPPSSEFKPAKTSSYPNVVELPAGVFTLEN